MSIKLAPVKSSNIVAFGYDAGTETLAVQFKSGIYHYLGVTPESASELSRAESVGSFIAKNIRPNHKAVLQSQGGVGAAVTR